MHSVVYIILPGVCRKYFTNFYMHMEIQTVATKCKDNVT